MGASSAIVRFVQVTSRQIVRVDTVTATCSAIPTTRPPGSEDVIPAADRAAGQNARFDAKRLVGRLYVVSTPDCQLGTWRSGVQYFFRDGDVFTALFAEIDWPGNVMRVCGPCADPFNQACDSPCR